MKRGVVDKSVVPLAPDIRELCVVTSLFALSCFPDRNNASAKEKTYQTQFNEGILSPTSGPVKWFMLYGLWVAGVRRWICRSFPYDPDWTAFYSSPGDAPSFIPSKLLRFRKKLTS